MDLTHVRPRRMPFALGAPNAAVANNPEANTAPSLRPADSVGQTVSFKVLGKPNDMPHISGDAPLPSGPCHDVVIVGGGLSGLTAMWNLKDRDTVLLESLGTPGGLAMHGHRDGMTYAEGAAYFTPPEGDLLNFYKEIGLGDPEKVEIHGPVDSYLVDGKLVEDVWEKGLDKLPPGFRRFKEYLHELEESGQVGKTPFETASEKVRALDKISAAQLIEPFGPELKTFLDLYCRSALGTTSEHVSAMAFLNFYCDEMGPRFAFPSGTGGVSQQLERRLRAHAPNAIQSGAFVYDVHHRPDGKVEVRYQKDGKNQALLAREVVMATPLSAAAKIVRDLPAERKQLIDSMEHSNYIVHNIFTPQTVFDRSYDTWVKGASFTDVIVGRWQATKGFTIKSAQGSEGILTVYQPLPREYSSSTLGDREVKQLAGKALDELKQLFPKLNQQKWIDVESFRWAQSMHITRPGLITEHGEELRKPFGHINFAGNDLGVPSFEEAIYRGQDAARSAEKALEVDVKNNAA